MSEIPTILIATTNDAYAAEVAQALGSSAVGVVAGSLTQAVDVSASDVHAVTVLDVDLAGVADLNVIRRLRLNGPVILIGGTLPDPDWLERAYAAGIADFVRLPLPEVVLRAKLGAFLAQRGSEATAAPSGISAEGARAPASAAERLQLLFDAATDFSLFFTDAAGLIVEWPLSAHHLLGYEPGDVVGRPIDIVFTPEDRAGGAPAHERAVALAEGQANDERWHLRKDGSRLFVSGRLIALRRADGALRAFAKIMRDATSSLALQESEAKFREIFETANEGIWMLDAGGRVQVVNRRMGEMLGYRPDEMLGRAKRDFAFAEDHAYIDRLFEGRQRGESAIVDVRFRHRDGREVWTLMSARPLHRGGVFAGALDMFTDNSERRAAEQARRAADEQFRVFFESSASGHVVIDPVSRRFLHTNARFREITGYSEEELRGMTYDDLALPDDRARDPERLTRLYRGEVRETNVVRRNRRKDGSTIWVETTATLVRNPDGSPRAHLSVVQDVTARKQAELARQATEAQLRVAIDAAELGTYVYDRRTHEMRGNERMRELAGLAGGEPLTPDAVLAHVHPHDRERVGNVWQAALASDDREYLNFEFRVVWADRSVHHVAASVRLLPGETSEGSGLVVGTLRDITAARQFSDELQRLVTERTAALEEKTGQLESFFYTVAHDLRSPLRAISGYAEIILQDFEPRLPVEAVGNLGRIRSSAQRLDQLIRDLLTYSRIAHVELSHESVPLRSVVDWALHVLQPEISGKGARIEVEPGLPVVAGERSLLEQVLLNLLSNALKFVAPGIVPHVRIGATEVGGGRVRLTVVDNGIGIAPEHHDRIFRVFERLKDAGGYPGTGVGLAIVARATDRLGGRAGVESRRGGGSTFWVELRRANS